MGICEDAMKVSGWCICLKWHVLSSLQFVSSYTLHVAWVIVLARFSWFYLMLGGCAGCLSDYLEREKVKDQITCMLGTGTGTFAGFQMVIFSYGTQDKERVDVSFPKLPRAIITSQETCQGSHFQTLFC